MKRRLEKGPLIPPSSVLQSEVAKKLPNRMSKWDHCQKTFKDELSSIVDVTDLPLSRWDKYIEEDNYDFEPCFSSTQAGGVGIYVANYIDYSVRRDLCMNLQNHKIRIYRNLSCRV